VIKILGLNKVNVGINLKGTGNVCEYSKMVRRKLGITDMSVPNVIGLALRHGELEIRSDIIAQLVFCKQVF